jgi:transcriptional regulator with XRE-family HTH domain
MDIRGAKEIGAALRAERLRKEWTQEQLSKVSGVKLRTVIECERGTSLPSLTTFARLCDALGISMDAVYRSTAAVQPRPAGRPPSGGA